MCLSAQLLVMDQKPGEGSASASRHLDMLGPSLGLCKQTVQFPLNLSICFGGNVI